MIIQFGRGGQGRGKDDFWWILKTAHNKLYLVVRCGKAFDFTVKDTEFEIEYKHIFFLPLASRNIHQICDLLSGDFTEYFGVYQGQESNIYTDQNSMETKFGMLIASKQTV